jgi:hypothetical protein
VDNVEWLSCCCASASAGHPPEFVRQRRPQRPPQIRQRHPATVTVGEHRTRGTRLAEQRRNRLDTELREHHGVRRGVPLACLLAVQWLTRDPRVIDQGARDRDSRGAASRSTWDHLTAKAAGRGEHFDKCREQPRRGARPRCSGTFSGITRPARKAEGGGSSSRRSSLHLSARPAARRCAQCSAAAPGC